LTIVIDSVRQSDSPLVETIMHGYTVDVGTLTRPAEAHWHMVLSKRPETTELLLVGPWSSAGKINVEPDGEVLWIRFKVGVYMPHLLTRKLLDVETPLPGASGSNFWLKGTTWEFPDYENTDTFLNRMVREELIVLDPVVDRALHDKQLDVSPRTVRHRFLQTTGMSQNQIYQVQRAWQAEALLRQRTPILDVVETAGYYDQPHLTRSLKQFIGFTPTQIQGQPATI